MCKLAYLCAGFCAIFLFSTYAFAAAADPAAEAVQKRYAAINGMKADFTQTLMHRESGNTETRKGTLYFAKPLKVRWETASPVPEILLITPDAVWNAFPDEDMAFKYPPDLSESESIVRVVTGQSALNKDFGVENKGTEKGLTRLVLYPNTPTQSMTEAELLVDAASGLIHTAIITDFYYNTNQIVFSNQDLVTDLPDSLFVFTPAKGMRVEDKTGGGAVSKPLMQ